MDDLNRRILEIPEEKIRLTNSGRLDFPVIPKLCIGRDCFRRSKVGEYFKYDKSEKCKSCLWYLLHRRRFTAYFPCPEPEWISRNQKFTKCRIGVMNKHLGIWLTKIDNLREEAYKELLPDIVKAYEIC